MLAACDACYFAAYRMSYSLRHSFNPLTSHTSSPEDVIAALGFYLFIIYFVISKSFSYYNNMT